MPPPVLPVLSQCLTNTPQCSHQQFISSIQTFTPLGPSQHPSASPIFCPPTLFLTMLLPKQHQLHLGENMSISHCSDQLSTSALHLMPQRYSNQTDCLFCQQHSWFVVSQPPTQTRSIPASPCYITSCTNHVSYLVKANSYPHCCTTG